MFEDIDDILRKGKESAGKDDDGPPNRRSSNRRRGPTEEDIARVLRDKFGGMVQPVPGGIIMGGHGGNGDPHKEIYSKLEGIINSLAYMAEQLGVKPTCVEATKQELAVGDVLKCPGGELKTVLKVGWKFAVLSTTEDQTKEDGPWFEEEMNLLNFIKKV